jgi:hypothetical protein
MPEVIQALYPVIGILWALVASFFFMCGGRSNDQLKLVHMDLWGWDKANRFWGRFFAPVLFGAYFLLFGGPRLAVFAFWATLFLVCRLPHGKPAERLLKAVLWPCGAIFLCWAFGSWYLLVLQIFSGLAFQAVFGIGNTKPAPVEEFLIYFGMSFLLPIIVV